MTEKTPLTNSQIVHRIAVNGKCYLAGEYLRDIKLGIKRKQVELSTNLTPSQLILLFIGDCETKSDREKFGIININEMEIRTFVKNTFYNRDIEFAETIEEDLLNKAFTIDSVAVPVYIHTDGSIVNGEAIDPLGGLEDLKNGCVKFIDIRENTAFSKIYSNPLLMIEACRIHGLLSNIKKAYHMPVTKTLSTILHNSTFLMTIDKYNIKTKLLDIMRQKNPSYAIRAMCDTGILKHVIPGLEDCVGLQQNTYQHQDVFLHCLSTADKISNRYPILRLAAILHDIGKIRSKNISKNGIKFYYHEILGSTIAKKTLENLSFSKRTAKYAQKIIEYHTIPIGKSSTDKEIIEFLSKIRVPIEDLFRLHLANKISNILLNETRNRWGERDKIKQLIKKIRLIKKEDHLIKIKNLKINGEDLKTMGFKEGPVIGEVLNDCLRWVMEDTSRNIKESLVVRVYDTFKTKISIYPRLWR